MEIMEKFILEAKRSNESRWGDEVFGDGNEWLTDIEAFDALQDVIQQWNWESEENSDGDMVFWEFRARVVDDNGTVLRYIWPENYGLDL